MPAPRLRSTDVAIAVAGLAVAAVALAGCGSEGENRATARPDLAGVEISIGSDGTDQGVLLAELYGAGLTARGATVTHQRGLESPADHLQQVERGELTLVPELTNRLLTTLVLVEPAAPAVRSVQDQIDAIDAALSPGLTVLTPASAQDKPAVVCRDDVAEEYGLTALSDLGRASAEIVLGGSDEPQSSESVGRAQLEAVLGARFMSFEPQPNAAATLDALDSGTIDCGVLRSTTVSGTRSAFTILDDDVFVVPADAIVPLIARDEATPGVQVVLDAVSSTLDTDSLAALLTEIRDDGADPAAVATAWMEANGLS